MTLCRGLWGYRRFSGGICLGESEDIFWSEHGLFWDVDMFGSVMWPYWYALGTVIYCSRGVGMFNRMMSADRKGYMCCMGGGI